MRKTFMLSTKLLAMGTGALLVALASIGFTLWVAWQLEGGAAAVNEAGRLRMNMLRMILAQQNESPQELAQLRQRFDAGLEMLRTGDPNRPLFVPWNDETRAQFEQVRTQWLAIQREWTTPSSAVSGAAAVARGDAFVSEIDGFVQAIEVRIMRWTAALHLRSLFLAALARARDAMSPDGLMPEDAPRTALRALSVLNPAMAVRQSDLVRSYTQEFARKAKQKYSA